MSTPKEIFNEVKSVLTSDSTLSTYVDAFYERYRDDLDRSKEIVVMIEPTDIIESKVDYPLRSVLVIVISGYMIEPDPDKSINDGSNKRIMDLEQDLKNALRYYYDLGGRCINFKFSSTRFDRKKHSWAQREMLRVPPLYGVEIYMNITYEPTFDHAGYGDARFGYVPLGY